MQLLVATGNAGKIREVTEALSPLQVLSPQSLPLPAPEVVEDGSTYFENALKKATAYLRVFGVPVLSDDSGLEVDALEGRPGLHSARYGGDISWPDRLEKLVKEIGKGAPRTARFRCVLCYFDGNLPVFFQGVSEGEIVAEATGELGFGYDPIFFSAPLGKTFGEATLQEKQRVSHRGRALSEFSDWFKRQ